MSAQTEYSQNIPVGYAGQLYDLSNSDIVSRSVASTIIEFGVAVSLSAGSPTRITNGSDQGFFGIAVRALDSEVVTGDLTYKQTESASVLRAGYIWAECVTGCVIGDVVNYTEGTGALNAGAAGVGEQDVANATWESAAGAGQLAQLRIGV